MANARVIASDSQSGRLLFHPYTQRCTESEGKRFAYTGNYQFCSRTIGLGTFTGRATDKRRIVRPVCQSVRQASASLQRNIHTHPRREAIVRTSSQRIRYKHPYRRRTIAKSHPKTYPDAELKIVDELTRTQLIRR